MALWADWRLIFAKKSRGVYTEIAMLSRASKPRKGPHDANQLARPMVEDLIGERTDGRLLPPAGPEYQKNPAAVALSKLGASKGGVARALVLSANQRSRIAKKAAKARWGK